MMRGLEHRLDIVARQDGESLAGLHPTDTQPICPACHGMRRGLVLVGIDLEDV